MITIRPNLYLGHEFDAYMDSIAKHKITVVYNVANDLNDPIYERKKCLTVKVGLSDDRKNAADMIELAVTTLGRLLEAGHTVLIHCRAGMSRSPYVLAMYLAEKENRTIEDVWEEIRKLRPEVLERSRLA